MYKGVVGWGLALESAGALGTVWPGTPQSGVALCCMAMKRLWHCRMRCAVVHYAVCMWAAHLAVFMYGCALVQYAVCMWVAHLAVFMYGCALVQYAVCMWVAHLAVFMYGCAIVQYAVCMWAAHPAVFMCCG